MAERGKSALLFGLGVAAGIGLAVLEEKYPTEKYETVDPLPLHFRALDLALEFAVMRFIGVYSHRWHWRNIDRNPDTEEFGVFLKGSSRGTSSHILFPGLRAHLGGRPEGYVIDINRDDPRTPPGTKTYSVGFRDPGGENDRVGILEISVPVFFLAGPDEGCLAFALDKVGQPLPIKKQENPRHRKFF